MEHSRGPPQLSLSSPTPPKGTSDGFAMGLGLLPLLWNSRTGADMIKRVAAPMVGGLASSFALELLVYPAVFALWKARRLGR